MKGSFGVQQEKNLGGPPLGLETPLNGYDAGIETTDLLEHGGGHVCVSLSGVSGPPGSREVDSDVPKSPEPQPGIPM